MPEYQRYSRNIWDYIKDMPYMPSREDREKLFRDEKRRNRVQLWDYFFRIKPEDVGKPQRDEIISIKRRIREDIAECEAKDARLVARINELEEQARRKAGRRLIIGAIIIFYFIFLIYKIPDLQMLLFQKQYIGSIVITGGIIMFFLLLVVVSISYIVGPEKTEIRILASTIVRAKQELLKKNSEAKQRIYALKKEVSRLRRQIPAPLSGERVREWLDEDLTALWHKAVREVALDRELVDIEGDTPGQKADNPIPILGPGELQSSIPEQFSVEINPDLNKHLTIKRSYPFFVDFFKKYDVLYGVYFIEYIIVAKDLLITYSFYYDFITGKISSEHITEQYYKDVVSLSIERDFRTLFVNTSNAIEKFYIEDAPTFTLSLSSGERHQVTFVNENYFFEIREELGIKPDEVPMVHWIKDSQRVANNSIKALRYHLRQHKQLNES